jgi:integrase
MKTKLTKPTIANLRAPTESGKQELVWDAETKGFGVLCSGVTSTKTYVVQRDLKSGKTRRVTIAPVNIMSLKDARARAGEVIADLIVGRDPKARGAAAATVAEAIELYVTKRGSKLRPRTAELYLDCGRRYLSRWATLPLRDLTPQKVEEEHARIGETFGPAAANNAMRVLRAAYNGVAGGADLPSNPVRLREHWFKLARREGRVKGDDLAKFFAAVWSLENPVQRDYLLLLLFTGLRRREAAGLRWDDVDFSTGVIRLPAARTKSGRKFDVPMTDVVRDLLIRRRVMSGEFVFPADSKSKHIEEPKAPLGLVKDACGIEVSAHDLRRTYLSIAERCVGGVALKALANHALADKDVTEGYVGIDPNEIKKAAQVVADRLRELCQSEAPSDTSRAQGGSAK